MQYSVNYLLASSMGGAQQGEPIDITVGVALDLREFPKVEAQPLNHESREKAPSTT